MTRSQTVDDLVVLSLHVLARINDAAAKNGISVSQLRLFGILRDREPQMLELAQLLGLDKSSVTGLVARAETRGLLERVPSVTDRRTVVVRLTKSGRALATELESGVIDALAPTIDAIPKPERKNLTRLVDTLRTQHLAAG